MALGCIESHRAVCDGVDTPTLSGRGINEILFPVGCSLVIYSATAFGKRVG